ncbi:SDR family NAD(P)-dependent oxidoreductase [Pseudomonas citronellolis]|uniref:SDR family NAD(P)-dependent oxidoreductase n=1 Tax=Pseudomonas citronellolis TaxID=53408 RepID=UPI0023E39738|nr:SDR family oxidoreductase [Pseudomonas citronellolis]MDF3931354.1 SDR family NAD(P)-dependent oxidoreductase [Pseudomonas citronellolis]
MSGRVVVITGAGTGIGAACARRFAEAGDQVVLIGRRRAALEAVAAQCGGLALAGDAADGEAWKGLLASIEDAHGGIDALIACAGGHGLGAAAETSDQAWREALRGNLDSAFASARACLPSLLQRRGNIVLVGSIASLVAGPGVCGYTTAKHALIGLMRSLARDYGPRGVRVNALCPGWVRTPMADAEMQPLMAHYGESLDAAYARVTAEVPLRRPATAEEIAGLCQFLASDAAAIITGACLLADGGASVVDLPTLAFERLEHAP